MTPPRTRIVARIAGGYTKQQQQWSNC